jgi:DNA-binding IclR family transcriptional regulator
VSDDNVEGGTEGKAKAPRESQTLMRSVDRVVSVLDALESNSSGMSVLDIARVTDLNRAVVHRLVLAMSGHELVDRTSSGKYQIGPRALLYANSYLDHLAIRRIALPYLVELRESVPTDQHVIVTLNIRVGAELAVVESIWDSRTALDSIMQVGTHFPLVESSSGIVIAAYMDESLLTDLVGARDAEALSPRLATIREAGGLDYTVGEYRAGIHGIAAVVFSEMTTDVAIAAYGRDLDLAVINRESDFASMVRRTADVIGEAMRTVG